MKCPNCGEESGASRTRCLKCGSPLLNNDVKASNLEESSNGPELKQPHLRKGSRGCSNCGWFNRENARFCTKCGIFLEGPAACPQCHGQVRPSDIYCQSCGHMVRVVSLTNRIGRPIGALLLGLIPGLLSLWGVGHFFAGNYGKGILFLLLGLLLLPISMFSVLSFGISMSHDLWLVVAWVILTGIIWIVLWLYQSVDAYHEAGGE
jgi:hypothetical protein